MEAGVREVGDVAMLLFPTIHRTEAPSSFALVQFCDHSPLESLAVTDGI